MASLKLQYQSVSLACCVVDHFIHGFPFQHLVRDLFWRFEGLAQQRCVTGISHIQGAAINDEIVEGFHLGISQSPRRFGQILCLIFQKMEDLIGADVIQEFLRMNRIESVKQEGVTRWFSFYGSTEDNI
jgi:hypothetical protein